MRVNKQSHLKGPFELIQRARLYRFAKQHENPIINFLYDERLRRVMKLITPEVEKYSNACVLLDLGCGRGYLSRVLSLQFKTIGIDVKKSLKAHLKVQNGFKRLDFILGDIFSLPLRDRSVDFIVCLSVLEHLCDLDHLVKKEIKTRLKQNGILIAGYPIETKFFKFAWKLISPKNFAFIDQSQTYFTNPYTGKRECYWKNPSTHKQDYTKIRSVLKRHFAAVQREKLPFNAFPDSLAYYEIMKMRNKT